MAALSTCRSHASGAPRFEGGRNGRATSTPSPADARTGARGLRRAGPRGLRRADEPPRERRMTTDRKTDLEDASPDHRLLLRFLTWGAPTGAGAAEEEGACLPAAAGGLAPSWTLATSLTAVSNQMLTGLCVWMVHCRSSASSSSA